MKATLSTVSKSVVLARPMRTPCREYALADYRPARVEVRTEEHHVSPVEFRDSGVVDRVNGVRDIVLRQDWVAFVSRDKGSMIPGHACAFRFLDVCLLAAYSNFFLQQQPDEGSQRYVSSAPLTSEDRILDAVYRQKSGLYCS